MKDVESLYVQYGCGLCAPPTWRNFDASPTLRLQRIPLLGRYFSREGFPTFPANVEYGDIVQGLPVAPESCRAVYSSHVLEHLALEDFRRALKNTYSHLARGGIFRFVLPDLEWLMRKYLERGDATAALSFMEESNLGRKTRPRGLVEFLRDWLGNSAHLWMWDFKAISAELEQTGFREIRRAKVGDSIERRFCEVEDPGRWEDCLGVECTK